MYVCGGTYSKCLEDIQMLDSNNRAGTFLVWFGFGEIQIWHIHYCRCMMYLLLVVWHNDLVLELIVIRVLGLPLFFV